MGTRLLRDDYSEVVVTEPKKIINDSMKNNSSISPQER